MSTTVFQEWRDQQRAARYPFVDGASLRSTDGMELPTSLFLDAVLHAPGGPEQRLSKISISGLSVTFCVADATQQLSSGTITAGTTVEQVDLLDEYGRPAGILVTDPTQVELVSGWPQGDHLFTAAATRFTAGVLVPVYDKSVSAIVLEDGEVFTGDVWLVGVDGVVLSPDGGAIRLDVVGAPRASEQFCRENNSYHQVWPLQTINGIPADEYGNFKLLPGSEAADDSIIRITRAGSGLVISLAGV